MLAAALATLSVLAVSPTPAQLEAFGREVEAQFARGEDGLGAAMDLDALGERALKDLDAPADYRKGFLGSLEKLGGSFGQALLVDLKAGGRFQYRKTVKVGGQRAVQLRLLGAGGGFSVLELVVERNASGALRVVDFFDLSAGELKSEELRRAALMGLAELNRNLWDRVTGKEQPFFKHVKEVLALFAASREGRHADVVAQFDALPPSVQETPSVLRGYVTACSAVDPARYEAGLARYLRLYPKDTASQVMAIDFSFLRKRWKEAEKAISAVEARVGTDDAWFEVLRANVALMQEKHDEAIVHLEAAVAREKKLPDSYFAIIGLALKQRDWPTTARWLEALEQDAGVVLNDLTQVPSYADFVASKEGKAFVKKQRQAAARTP